MASHDDNEYFIVKADLMKDPRIKAGMIGYIQKTQYPVYSQKKDASTITGRVLDNYGTVDCNLPPDILYRLKRKQAEFLLALESPEERLKVIAHIEVLDQAIELTKDSEVKVEQNGEWLKGVVRYIGAISVSVYSPDIKGAFFGVELQGEDKGKGQTDGTYGYLSFFKCPRNCGIFVPFTRIKPLHPKPSATWFGIPDNPIQNLAIGDRVTFILDDKNDCQFGMVLDPNKDGKILVSTDIDEHGKAGGEKEIPWHCIIKEDSINPVEWQRCKTERMDISENLDLDKDSGADVAIKVGSRVKINLAKGSVCGSVHWIGFLTGMPSRMAGLELDEACGVSDGTFRDSRIFKCPPKHGLFVKVSSCQLAGDHFLSKTGVNSHFDSDVSPVPPLSSEDVMKFLIGQMKGVQGHCNSCYMDSALFSLFSCSSVLDSLLFKNTRPNDEPIQKTLLRDIVCPLRSKGFVPAKSVMKLRNQLQERGHCPSYTTDEKDPEEFLNLIMQDILSLEPLLKMKSCNPPKGITAIEQTSHLYQIFMDYNHSLVLPTVQQLLEHSFFNSDIKLAEVPSCLILTMPRSGKQFKMFPKIIPSLQLDITALLSNGLQHCVLCGKLAHVECNQCFTDSAFSSTGLKVYCEICSNQVHIHPSRQSHKPSKLCLPEGFPHSCNISSLVYTPVREKLELFAVLCIETSHYVSFVKHGPQITDWIFFDSMADRKGETNGFNIPEVKACPEVGRYLNMPLAELAKQVPREMDGVAKRLFCDGYMYLYQSPRMALYL